MRILKGILNTLVFSNVYIALVALLMYMDIAKQCHLPVSTNIQGIVFHGTLLVYSIHWFFNWNKTGKTERLRWNAQYKWIVALMGILGGVGVIRYTIENSLIIPYLFTPAVLITLYELRMFNRKNIRFKLYGKTLILTFTWIYATALMPMLYHHIAFDLNIIATIGMQGTVVYLAALLFDKRDSDTEKQFHLFYNNIKYFGLSVTLNNFLALTFFLIAVLMHQANAFIWGKLFVMILLNISIRYQKTKSDYWYYLLIDGLMGLPVGLLWKLL